MHSLRNQWFVLVVAIFPIALLLHRAAFFILPFLAPLVTALLVGLIGSVVAVMTIWRLAKLRSLGAVVAVFVALATWLVWFFLPTPDLSIRAKFEFERHRYEMAVVQSRNGSRPACLASGECLWDGAERPYLVFPFRGLVTGSIGVVYVPEENQAPQSERLASLGVAGCEAQPISPHFYICGFV